MKGTPLPIRLAPDTVIAYFSMEIGLDSAIPTYSGGLGVLAGDTLRAAADAGIPLVGVTLVHRKGYFRQHLDGHGNQSESPDDWSPENLLEPVEPRVAVTIEGRSVQVRAWRYLVQGVAGAQVPVYLLDTNLPENTPWDRTLTDYLYGGDQHYRLCQEAVLGLGGLAMLRALGYSRVQAYHMNEGHSALLTIALLREHMGDRPLPSATLDDVLAVRRHCVFTTHTPVPAGHDQFPLWLAQQVLGDDIAGAIVASGCCFEDKLNMTYLALRHSRYINGVSMRHEEVSQDLFPDYPINSITNGVHALTWTCPSFRKLYDEHIPQWRRDNIYLRQAIGIPVEQILAAHDEAKAGLLVEVERRTGQRLDPDAFTIGFARRAAAYKRADLLFSNLDRLQAIARRCGPIQVIFGGKAHPNDEMGKRLIRNVHSAAEALRNAIRVLYLAEYDMELGQRLCAGVDVWLNTPEKPMEASGTSGMKAAMNGVPSLSVLDGWWVEGHIEGVTGWSIGEDPHAQSDREIEAASLYDKLEHVILPLYYERPEAYGHVMRGAIAFNGSFFHAQRMVRQYLANAYLGNGE